MQKQGAGGYMRQGRYYSDDTIQEQIRTTEIVCYSLHDSLRLRAS
mgnify:CR=1 FL=1|jgi:hypothetical protein